MKEFITGLGMRQWVWPNWEAMYSELEDGRIRLIGRDKVRIIGCVDVLISPSGDAGVNYISVTRDIRHRGIGSHLLRAAGRLAQERGATSLAAYNVIVEPFYLQNGWRVQSEYRRMSLRRHYSPR